MRELQAALLQWLLARPERCKKCGTVHAGSDMTNDLRDDSYTCDACVKVAPAKS